MTTNETLDLGNNETLSHGVFLQDDGSYLALTFTKSRTFKSRKAAERWLAQNSTYRAARNSR